MDFFFAQIHKKDNTLFLYLQEEQIKNEKFKFY